MSYQIYILFAIHYTLYIHDDNSINRLTLLWLCAVSPLDTKPNLRQWGCLWWLRMFVWNDENIIWINDLNDIFIAGHGQLIENVRYSHQVSLEQAEGGWVERTVNRLGAGHQRNQSRSCPGKYLENKVINMVKNENVRCVSSSTLHQTKSPVMGMFVMIEDVCVKWWKYHLNLMI